MTRFDVNDLTNMEEFLATSDRVSDSSCLEGLTETDTHDTCELCGHRLTLPVILNCLHRFDRVCLEREQRRTLDDPDRTYPVLACPTCNEPTILSSGGIPCLPHDWLFVQV